MVRQDILFVKENQNKQWMCTPNYLTKDVNNRNSFYYIIQLDKAKLEMKIVKHC